MLVKDAIISKLNATFAPEHLEVIDESELHRGHGGWREGGETHFRVVISAQSLADKSRVEQHRAINDCLAEELEEQVHALVIKVK